VPFPLGRRIATSLAVLALVLVGSATLALPASAAPAPAATVTGPADGAVVGGTAVSFSVTPAAEASGYQLRWGTDPSVDAQSGRLTSTAGGGDAIVTTSEYALIDLGTHTYYWQVRSLEDGAGSWSVPRSFTVDPEGAGLQLETYPLDAPSAAAPAPGPFSGVGGGVWIGSASVFAVLFLIVVLYGASRARRAA
jgi:hypothetical protein